jgi:hypothetical protein
MKKLKRRLEEELHLQKIRVRKGINILRWGNKGEGMFKVREAYLLAVGLTEAERKRDWTMHLATCALEKILTFYG